MSGCVAWRLQLGELLEFTNRQLKITRVYAPHLWKPVLLGSFLFCLVFFGGLASCHRARDSGICVCVAAPVVVIFLVGRRQRPWFASRQWLLLWHSDERNSSEDLLAHLAALAVGVGALSVQRCRCGILAAHTWRGITYELKSPTEAVIIEQTVANRLSVVDCVSTDYDRTDS